MIDEIDEHGYSEYIIYGDETGDHSMSIAYEQHPVFALAFCVFSVQDYVTKTVQYIKNLKFKFWGHDAVILHSAKLRKQIDDFRFLQNRRRREFFLEEVSQSIRSSPFTIIATGIDKRLLLEQYSEPENPYELSLEYCLERTYLFLAEKNQLAKLTYIVIESRGYSTDKSLKFAFEKILKQNYILNIQYPLKLLFVEKKTNSIGLQIADLVAYPIGRFIVAPQNKNPAFEVISEKFYKYPNYRDAGLKIFPSGSDIAKKRKAPEHSEALSVD